MAHIISAHTSFPEHKYSQEEIMNLVKKIWPDHAAVIDRLVGTSGVKSRNTVLPLERYQELGGFEARNGIFIEQMLRTLERAVVGLHEEIQFDWKDLAIMTSTTITGIAVPSLDARLMNRLPIPKNIIRNPLFGIGCLGGIAALNRTKVIFPCFHGHFLKQHH